MTNNEIFGEGITFERIRRISGYLVGDYKTRFNDAKRKECEERVKHEEKENWQDTIQEIETKTNSCMAPAEN